MSSGINSTLELQNITITCTSTSKIQPAILVYRPSKLIISSGTYTATNRLVRVNESNINYVAGDVTITGGTLTSTNYSAVEDYGTGSLSGSGKLVSNASRKEYVGALMVSDTGSFTMSGGTLQSSSGYALYNSGTFKKTGGTISGSTYGY